MSITNAQILTAVNDNLEREETDIDRELKRVLFKVSNAGNFLSGTDTSQTIDSTTTTASYPDCYRAINYIRLMDTGTSEIFQPLDVMSWSEYLNAVVHAGSSAPAYYSIWNNTFYFLPAPGTEYQVQIYYFKIHEPDPDTIEFDDRFLSVLESGTTYEVASTYGLVEQMQIWGARYADDLKEVMKYSMSPIKTVKFSRY